MKKLFLLFNICAVLLCLGSNTAFAQRWDVYEADDFNIQFQVPADWTTRAVDDEDVPYLESVSADESIYMFAYAYKDETISTKELFYQTVDDLDFKTEGDVEEEDINGLHAWVGVGVGRIDGEKVGMFIMSATFDENNYVVYIFTEYSRFDDNEKVMNKILDSFAPLED